MQAFISHSVGDAAVAHRVAADLRAARIGVWIAPDSIRPGEGWVEALNRGLEESTHVIVLLTPRAVESMWVRQEVNTAIIRERSGKVRLIPVEVEPSELPALWSGYQAISMLDYEIGVQQLITVVRSRKSSGGLRTKNDGSGRASNRRTDEEMDTHARIYDALVPRLPDDLRNWVLNTVVVDPVYQMGARTELKPAAMRGLFQRGGDGDRLVSLLLMQTRPDTATFDLALDALKSPRSPFEQFHGLRLLYLMVERLDPARISTLRGVLRAERRRYLTPANQSRWELAEELDAKLQRRSKLLTL